MIYGSRNGKFVPMRDCLSETAREISRSLPKATGQTSEGRCQHKLNTRTFVEITTDSHKVTYEVIRYEVRVFLGRSNLFDPFVFDTETDAVRYADKLRQCYTAPQYSVRVFRIAELIFPKEEAS